MSRLKIGKSGLTKTAELRIFMLLDTYFPDKKNDSLLDVSNLTEQQILTHVFCGKKLVSEIKEWLYSHGKQLREDQQFIQKKKDDLEKRILLAIKLLEDNGFIVKK